MINLSKLAEQQKNQRALNLINRILKQTIDKKLAESLSPITNVSIESTQKLGEVIEESDSGKENNQEIVPVEIESDDKIKANTKALPNSSKFDNSMGQMIGSLMNSRNSLKITHNESGGANF